MFLVSNYFRDQNLRKLARTSIRSRSSSHPEELPKRCPEAVQGSQNEFGGLKRPPCLKLAYFQFSFLFGH